MDLKKILERVQNEFVLSLNGIHGVSHWQRVLSNGLRLAESTGANTKVVELFAYLHDSKRMNDSLDYEHGRAAGEFIKSLKGSLIIMPDNDFERLVYACEYHSDGLTEADVTVQTCWDADRLDLGRAGIKPESQCLCTPAAKDSSIIEWAYLRSITNSK